MLGGATARARFTHRHRRWHSALDPHWTQHPHQARPPNAPPSPPSNLLTVDGDRFVLAQAKAGNREAFRTLVERHSRAVFRVAYRITGSEADAEDVVQETFLRAYTELGRFEARAGFGTWVHRIAANCAIDLIRRRPKHIVAEEDARPSRCWPGWRARRPGPSARRRGDRCEPGSKA